MAENVFHVNDDNFESEVLQSNVPVLVDFWAPWCGPCLALAPTIEALANENLGTVKICKLNVDESPDTASQFGIRGIPTMILFKNGQNVGQVTGAVPKKQIEMMIASV